MKNALYVLIGLSLAVSSCDKEGVPLESPKDTKLAVKMPVVTNLDNDLMLKLVNDKRAVGCNCGKTVMPPVPLLTWNHLLAAASLAHSQDMAANNYFAHESPNGKTTTSRVDAVGYNWVTLSENIANGHSDEQAVVDAWMASEGHCKNIMSVNVKEMGAAKEGKYWTQVFGRTK